MRDPTHAGKNDHFWSLRFHAFQNRLKSAWCSASDVFVFVVVQKDIGIQVGAVQNGQDLGGAVNVKSFIRSQQTRDCPQLDLLDLEPSIGGKPRPDSAAQGKNQRHPDQDPL